MEGKHYRMYIDESGDHTYSVNGGDGKRYLGITGIIFESQYYKEVFHPAFEAFKQKHFPHSPDEPIVLHRKELINKSGPFWRLLDEKKEKSFNEDFLKLLAESDYKIISVVIDKKAHVDRYGALALHPYHVSLIALLESYCGLLNFSNTRGDVLAESRGGHEDMQLKEAYKTVYESGTTFRKNDFFQKSLKSKEIKIKPKSANIAGLQLADLLAHPCKHQILFEHKKTEKIGGSYAQKITEVISTKYNKGSEEDIIEGYGRVFIG